MLYKPNHPTIRFAVLTVALVFIALALGGYYLRHLDYYSLTVSQRPLHGDDPLLRPSGFLGLRSGLLGLSLCLISCLYLLRRRWPGKRRLGPMPVWLDFHILTAWTGTGLVLLHSAGLLRSYLGSLAALSLVALAVSGCVGRFLGVGGPGPIDCRPQDIPPQGVWTVWRFLHRWAAVLFVCAVIGHVVVALGFGDLHLRGSQP